MANGGVSKCRHRSERARPTRARLSAVIAVRGPHSLPRASVDPGVLTVFAAFFATVVYTPPLVRARYVLMAISTQSRLCAFVASWRCRSVVSGCNHCSMRHVRRKAVSRARSTCTSTVCLDDARTRRPGIRSLSSATAPVQFGGELVARRSRITGLGPRERRNVHVARLTTAHHTPHRELLRYPIQVFTQGMSRPHQSSRRNDRTLT